MNSLRGMYDDFAISDRLTPHFLVKNKLISLGVLNLSRS